MVTLCGIAAASELGHAPRRRSRGDRDQRLPVRAGPRPQPRVRATPRRRLRARRHREDPRARPDRDAQPARPRRRSSSGPSSDLDAEVLVDIAERSMSAPIYDLLKRPDELFVVEHAHLQPRFVEDSVRHCAPRRARLAARSSTTTTSSSRAGQLRDDPRPRRRRRALRHGRRAARRARDGRAEPAPDDARRLARGLERAPTRASGAVARSGARCRRRAGGCSGGA